MLTVKYKKISNQEHFNKILSITDFRNPPNLDDVLTSYLSIEKIVAVDNELALIKSLVPNLPSTPFEHGIAQMWDGDLAKMIFWNVVTNLHRWSSMSSTEVPASYAQVVNAISAESETLNVVMATEEPPVAVIKHDSELYSIHVDGVVTHEHGSADSVIKVLGAFLENTHRGHAQDITESSIAQMMNALHTKIQDRYFSDVLLELTENDGTWTLRLNWKDESWALKFDQSLKFDIVAGHSVIDVVAKARAYLD